MVGKPQTLFLTDQILNMLFHFERVIDLSENLIQPFRLLQDFIQLVSLLLRRPYSLSYFQNFRLLRLINLIMIRLFHSLIVIG